MAGKLDYGAILTEAMTAAGAAPVTERSGCGRVYVMLVGTAHRAGISKASKASSIRYFGAGKGRYSFSLYVGYDNADGRALARGAAIARVLKDRGIDCYRDEVED